MLCYNKLQSDDKPRDCMLWYMYDFELYDML